MTYANMTRAEYRRRCNAVLVGSGWYVEQIQFDGRHDGPVTLYCTKLIPVVPNNPLATPVKVPHDMPPADAAKLAVVEMRMNS